MTKQERLVAHMAARIVTNLCTEDLLHPATESNDDRMALSDLRHKVVETAVDMAEGILHEIKRRRSTKRA